MKDQTNGLPKSPKPSSTVLPKVTNTYFNWSWRFAVLFVLVPSFNTHAQDTLTGYTAKEVLLLMGTRFELGAFAKTQAAADHAVADAIAEIWRIEALISSWDPNSQTSKINATAGDSGTYVDEELYRLIERSLKISALTDGAFDITAGGFNRLYRFGGQDTTLPSIEVLANAVSTMDYHQIDLAKDKFGYHVKLNKAGFRIGFGAIGKGYAANMAREVMRRDTNVLGGVVNAAGDLATFGINEQGASWKIGITDPINPQRWLGELEVGELAVVTSGDYEKYFMVNGQRYSHIIDPRTALPTQGVRSVTIVCPNAEIADALATSVFVLGETKGLALINRLKNIEGLIITEDGRKFSSQGLTLLPKT